MLSIKQEFEEQFFFFLIELPQFGLYSLRQIFPIVKQANF